MQSKWYGRVGLAALCLGVMGGTGSISGCASERDPINRVQPGVVDKTFFLGQDLQDYKDDPEFRTRSFAIDSAAGAMEDTIGLGATIDRIRWEVTENYLIARRSYQEAPGVDAHGLPRVEVSPGVWQFPTAPSGTIVAAYKIEKQFDIRRDYNSQTGEETNVIVENDQDRPWQDRQYMRVDWSMNMAYSTSDFTDGNSYFSKLFGDSTSAVGVAFNVSNENDPNAPLFENDGSYFDVTNKYTLNPETNPSFGVPDCVLLAYFNGSSAIDCSPAEVTMRHSFQRLTGNEDYEPFNEPLATDEVIGSWAAASSGYAREGGTTAVSNYDPQYGYTDPNTHIFMPSHNIWEKSHQMDKVCYSNDDADKNGTADECENSTTGYTGNEGSQCDIWINGGNQVTGADGVTKQPGKCTIPVRDRRIKTIAYWLNTDAPQWMEDQLSSDGKTITEKGALEENTRTWNLLMLNAVAARREVECRRTGFDTRDNCHLTYFTGNTAADKTMVPFGGWGVDTPIPQAVDKDDNGFQLSAVTMCHNPVNATDDPLCGKPGDITRLGDMRHNYAIFWDYDSEAHYGGVASIPADPVTGEMLGVTATSMMRSVTFAAAQQRDIIQIALGDITVDDLVAGVQANNYAGQVKNGKSAGPLATGLTDAHIAQTVKLAQATQPKLQAQWNQTPEKLAALSQVQRKANLSLMQMQRSPNATGAGTNAAVDNQRLQTLIDSIKGVDVTAQGIGNRTLTQVAAASASMNTALSQAITKFAQTDAAQYRILQDQFSAYLANHGVCFQDPEQEAGVGSIYQPQLAGYFKQLYGNLDPKTRGDKIYNDLAREAVKGIAFHEIGHSLGMRHNFSSSWDSLNYQPQYWQLRTNEGQSTDACTAARTGGADTCMGPRYLDPETDEEQGLGSESRPGIEYFANSSTMEYQIERFGETTGAGTYDLHFMKTLYGRVAETFDAKQVATADQVNLGPLNLSQAIPADLVFDSAQNQFGLHYTRAAMAAKVFDPNRDCRAATDEEKTAAKWRIVHGKVCGQSPKNVLAYQDMTSDALKVNFGGVATPIGANGVRWHGVDETGKTLTRWPFRYGEDYSTGGYTHAKMMDSGADFYEITVNTTRAFDLKYPWSYFRRGSKQFSWWSLSGTVAKNYFARLRGYHWETATDIGNATAPDLANDDANRPDVMANEFMFNFLQRAILTPEPGIYASGANTTSRTPKRPGALTIYDLQDDNATGGGIAVANIGLIDGRYVQIDFDSDRGGWDYGQYPTHMGFDEEKALAIRELVDSRPTLSTVSRENALDGRDPYISFRTDTPQALDRLIGGIVSEDWETIAPAAVGQDGTMTGFSLLPTDSTQLVRPSGANIIFPNMGYSNELGTAIYGMLYSRFSTDMEMATKMRVRYDGDSGPVIPEALKQGYLDPVSGIHYLATKFGTEMIQGRAVETGIASRMLQHANDLLVQAYQVDTTKPANAYGEPQLVLDAVTGRPKSLNNAAATLALTRYVGFLDGMRQIGNIFGGGPLGGGGGGDDGED